MLKVTVLGHGSVAQDAIERLQKAGVIQIIQSDMDEEGRTTPLAIEPVRLHELEQQIASAQFVRDFLGRFHEADVAFGTFVAEKIHLSVDEFEALVAADEFQALYDECDAISGRLGSIERERVRQHQLELELLPWTELHLQISQWKGTAHVSMATGTVPANASAVVRQALRDAVSEVTVAEVGKAGDREAWVVMAHCESTALVKATLALHDFVEVTFPGLADYPAEELATVRAKLVELDAEQSEAIARASELASEYPKAVALVQARLTGLDAVEVRSSFAATERAFSVTGWVPERRRNELVAALAPIGTDLDLDFAVPDAEDHPPVELINNRWVRPFEVLTDLYGRPKYFAFDPTPVIAPFFFLFFGMCLGDVGYGVMLLVGAWLIKTRLDVGPGVQKFMDLLILGGVASIIWGALTRSYLALSVEKLPSFLLYKPMIDPASELMLLLGVCVAIGVVHVSVGVGLAFIASWRSGDREGAITSPGSSLVFILCLVGMVLAVAGVIDSGLAMPLLGFGAAQLVLLQGRITDVLARRVPAWHLALVPLKGFLGLYGMIGYGSDFLSYTRLAALGLASLYVGDAMNRLTELSGGIPYVGWLIAVTIFVVGHTFNVVINLLGAFVHPTRLQFVEFFGKFYEGGGISFAPFAPRSKQLVLRPRTAGEQEGGTRS
ncbi:MAG: V-type ATP synthase subunit I [Actinomycetota bacterium]|nr:V-type ATP synthase subunit I [Actinomycetota bacterium]